MLDFPICIYAIVVRISLRSLPQVCLRAPPRCSPLHPRLLPRRCAQLDALALADQADLVKSMPTHFTEAQRVALADAIVRYFYYVEVGIRDDEIAPLKEEWPVHVMELVPPEPPRGVSQEFYDNLLRESRREMEDDYLCSMKRAIVDYCLQNPFERQRLNLEALEPLVDVPRPAKLKRAELPEQWGIAVDQARENVAWTLQTLSPNALELSALWKAFQVRERPNRGGTLALT